jgi:hypothetical protein
MTEQEWLTCTDPGAMERFLQTRATSRKARLYCCACCRRIWDLMTDQRCRVGVAVAEAYADGHVSLAELRAAHANAAAAAGNYIYNVFNMAEFTTHPDVHLNGWVASTAANHAGGDEEPYCEPLRSIFGNPFRPVALDAVWRTATVRGLAQAAYDDRTLPAGTLDPMRLAVLADALEEAGCVNAEILNHLRGPGEHVRGCWAVDLLLGKE